MPDLMSPFAKVYRTIYKLFHDISEGSMFDKRIAPRIPTSMVVALSKAGDFLCATIMNISSSGAFIKTETVLPVDTELALRIRLPEDLEIMDIVGKVVWEKQASNVSPAGMGIEFIRILSKDRRKIHCFVESCRQESPPYKVADEAAMLS
jgi:uncharacterized protein (TIGR02266 family)